MGELLKQPLQTKVSLSNAEMDDFHFENGTHVVLELLFLKVFVYGYFVNLGRGSFSRKLGSAISSVLFDSRETVHGKL